MGGSSGGGGNSGGSAPPQAEQIDYGKMMESASAAARAQVEAQYENLVKYYPQIEALQLGTVSKVAGNLNNDYTKLADASVKESLAQRAGINAQATKMAGLGDTIANISMQTAGQGPSSIEQELYRQAEADLGQGRSLSAAELRDAQQSARAALGARGLGTSAAGTATEILNRDAAAQAREAARRNFAGAVNQQYFQNRMALRDQAANQAALAGNMMGNASNVYGQSAGLGMQAAGTLTQIDPYARALGQSSPYTGQNLATQASLIGNTYSNATNMAGNTASFNANLLDSRYNSYMNNQASLQAAGMQSSAMNNAATMGMIGSIGGGLLSGAGMGLMMSDKREKTNIEPMGKAAGILGLPAYRFDYKDARGGKGVVGLMAQDVRKVLPEAVEEVSFKGKKRLAIKPAVIGAALAEELAGGGLKVA